MAWLEGLAGAIERSSQCMSIPSVGRSSNSWHPAGLLDGSSLARLNTQTAKGLVIGYAGPSTLSSAT